MDFNIFQIAIVSFLMANFAKHLARSAVWKNVCIIMRCVKMMPKSKLLTLNIPLYILRAIFLKKSHPFVKNQTEAFNNYNSS